MRAAYVCLWSGIITGVFGQVLLKAGAQAPDFWAQVLDVRTVAGLVLYVGATVFYMIALRRIPLSVAFPSISVSYIVIVVLGALLFGESVTVGKFGGLVMIAGGVWLLNSTVEGLGPAEFPLVAYARGVLEAEHMRRDAGSPSAAEFDKFAASYDGGLDNPIKSLLGRSPDQFIGVKAHWLMRHEPQLETGGLEVLDYGCGAGDLMRLLRQFGSHADLTGCDISGGMLAAAANRWPPELGSLPKLVAQDGARTPFEAGRFDIVMASAVLHHVAPAQRSAVYAELARVLKPGGRVYVFEHNPRNPLVRYVVARTAIDENAILLDAREVCQGLHDAECRAIATEYIMFMPPGIPLLRRADWLLARVPMGAQYVVSGRKPEA